MKLSKEMTDYIEKVRIMSDSEVYDVWKDIILEEVLQNYEAIFESTIQARTELVCMAYCDISGSEPTDEMKNHIKCHFKS